MKKVCSILLLILSSSGICQATKTVKTTGKLGAGSSCSGFGVCEVKTTSQSPTGLSLTWTLNTSQTVLTLFIETADVENVPDNIADELAEGQFIMSTAFTFPAEVAAALESTGSLTIPSGNYTASHGVSGYTINFNLE